MEFLDILASITCSSNALVLVTDFMPRALKKW